MWRHPEPLIRTGEKLCLMTYVLYHPRLHAATGPVLRSTLLIKPSNYGFTKTYS